MNATSLSTRDVLWPYASTIAIKLDNKLKRFAGTEEQPNKNRGHQQAML